MKALGVAAVSLFLGLGGAAIAGDYNEDCGNSCTNSTGPNPFMPEFSTPSSPESSVRTNDEPYGSGVTQEWGPESRMPNDLYDEEPRRPAKGKR